MRWNQIPSHSILFYDERETNDRSLTRDFKTKKIRKFENSKTNNQQKKRWFCEFHLFICCTYIHTYLVPTYYTYMRSFCPLSLQKTKKKAPSLFCFSLRWKVGSDRRGKEKKGQKEKKEKKKKENRFIFYLHRDVGFFFFFFLFLFKRSGILIYRYM